MDRDDFVQPKEYRDADLEFKKNLLSIQKIQVKHQTK